MKHQAVYTVCVILELFVFHAGSTKVEHKSGLTTEHVAKRSSESTWSCHAGCKKFCLPSCKRSCCAPGAQPYHPGMFNQLLNYQASLPPPPQMPPPMPPPMPQPQMMASAAGQCAQGCPQSCAPSCQPQCCSGGQMGAQPMQPSPYGYQQGGRSYQQGLANPGYPQYGRNYQEGLAGNAAYQDENDMYNVHIPSAFERLKALRKPSPRYKPVNKAKPNRKTPAKRYRHRFYDKDGNPHDEIVYDGARCDPSCRKLCEPSCRFECCVGAAPTKKKATKKLNRHQPVPTLVSPVQTNGKLTYPYADVTPAPDQAEAQNVPLADTSAGAQVPEPEQPAQPAQEGAPEESSDLGTELYGQPTQYGQRGGYGSMQRPGQYPGYNNQGGYPGQPLGMHGNQIGTYPGSPGGYPGSPGRYPGTHGGYHGSHGGHPGSPAGYPGTHGGYPGTYGGYSGSPGAYPGSPGQQGYPGGQQGYPLQIASQSGQYGGYPGQQGYPTVQPGAPGGQQASYAQGLSQNQCRAPCPQACAPSCSQQCCNPAPPPVQQCGGGCSNTCAPQCAPKCCWDKKRSNIPKTSH